MLHNMLLACFLLLFAAVSAFAADNPSGKNDVGRGGGLVCRSVEGRHGQSCDALCAKAEMVCTSVADHGRDPPLTCGRSIDDTILPFPVCQCCALDHH